MIDPPRWAHGLVVAVLLAASCAAVDGSLADRPAVVASPQPASGVVFEELLAALPNPDGTLIRARLIDYRSAFAQANIEWPENCEVGEFREHGRNMSEVADIGLPWSILIQEATRGPVNFASEFGIGLCEIQGEARYELLHGSHVLIVDTPAEVIDAAVSEDPVWSTRLSETAVAGYTVYDWGADVWPDDESPARIIGEAGQLAVDGRAVIRSQFGGATDLIGDAANESLLAREHVAEVVAILANEGAVAISLVEGVRESSTGPAFVWWELMGQGARQSESGEALLTVVMVHESEQDARLNAERFASVIARGGTVAPAQLTVVESRFESRYSIATLTTVEGSGLTPMQVVSIEFTSPDGLFDAQAE